MATKKIDVKYYSNRAAQKRKGIKAFLNKIEKKKPRNLASTAKKMEAETWQEINCLTCGNCCLTMTPTWKKAEVNRVAAHLGMTYQQFFDKWLMIDEENGDIVNQDTPCQFFHKKSGMCTIYEIRPSDCSGFPHLHFRRWLDYEVYTDNLHRCPATLVMMEKMKMAFEEGVMK
ncbi:MAG: YkgJ family cysteine cluster protein [Flavobacteriales bacterium]|nr:YkgJ family cysteine cluster protein [Flavobacteriales bacterium]